MRTAKLSDGKFEILRGIYGMKTGQILNESFKSKAHGTSIWGSPGP